MSEHTVTERVRCFDCEGDTLVGILHEPAHAAEIGVIVIVGGPQYRAGSHRQFVLLARALADAGFAVLRFDARGTGDSGGAPRGFEGVGADVAAAIASLQSALPGVRRVALWGLCDGASAALLYVETMRDPRVAGLCLLNPWVRSAASLARTHIKHHYTQRLRQREFWVKLLTGRVGAKAWRGFIGNLRAQHAMEPAEPSFQQQMARAWAAFEGKVLLVLSGNDYTAKEFVELSRNDPAWAGALQHPRTRREDVATADHTFSSAAWREQVNNGTIAWLRDLAQAEPASVREAA